MTEKQRYYKLISDFLKSNKIFFKCDYDEESDLYFECEKDSMEFFIQTEFDEEKLIVIGCYFEAGEYNNSEYNDEAEYKNGKWLSTLSDETIINNIETFLDEVSRKSNLTKQIKRKMNEVFELVTNEKDLNIIMEMIDEFSVDLN
jgi:hypothetical protein